MAATHWREDLRWHEVLWGNLRVEENWQDEEEHMLEQEALE
jgi:hypothetical protein